MTRSLVIAIVVTLIQSLVALGADIGSSIPCPCDQCECTPAKNCGCGGLMTKSVPVPPPAPPATKVCDANGCYLLPNPSTSIASVTNFAQLAAPGQYTTTMGGRGALLGTRLSTPFLQRSGPVRGIFHRMSARAQSRGCN